MVENGWFLISFNLSCNIKEESGFCQFPPHRKKTLWHFLSFSFLASNQEIFFFFLFFQVRECIQSKLSC